jgi:hypothetical protein
LAYLVPLDVDVVPIKFHQFLFGEYHFCVFQFFSISGVTMAMTAILKKINPSQHNITWHMIFLQGAAVAMETKKGGFKQILDSFHQTS